MEFKEPFKFAEIDKVTYGQNLAGLHPELNGKRISKSNKEIFFILEGQKCFIPDTVTYNNLFNTWDDIIELSSESCELISRGPDFAVGSMIIKDSDYVNQYLLFNKQKLFITSIKVKEYCKFAGCRVFPHVIVDSIPTGVNINYGNED